MAPGIDGELGGGRGHDRPDGRVRQQQARAFLVDPDGLLTAQRMCGLPQAGIEIGHMPYFAT
jgi:hypothetical protein